MCGDPSLQQTIGRASEGGQKFRMDQGKPFASCPRGVQYSRNSYCRKLTCELSRQGPPKTRDARGYRGDSTVWHLCHNFLAFKRYLRRRAVFLSTDRNRHAIAKKVVLPWTIFHVLYHVAANRKHHAGVFFRATQNSAEAAAHVRQLVPTTRLDPTCDDIWLNIEQIDYCFNLMTLRTLFIDTVANHISRPSKHVSAHNRASV